ncbi:MAG: hypothetical protein RLP02_40455, partial [Coleofasciculus sp. C2-GNP5-27]
MKVVKENLTPQTQEALLLVQVQVPPERVQVQLCETREALGAVPQALGQVLGLAEPKPLQVELGQVLGLAEQVWVRGLTVWGVDCWALCC